VKVNMKKIAEANVSNDGDYESLPEAWYPLQIENAEYMEARTGAFQVKVTFVVFDGQYKNRKVWNNYGIINKDGVENGVGQGMLANLLRAAKSPLVDTDEELEIEDIVAGMANLKVNGYLEPSSFNGKPGNDLKKIQALDPSATNDAGATDSGNGLFS
jgi:hypothetical protein